MTKDPEMDGPARASPTQPQPHSSGPIAAPVFFLRIGDSSRLSSPYYGGPRVRIPVPPDATCKTCGACARVRDAVIGFPAHGAWQKVEKAIAARDVPPGEPWVFRDHRT